MNCITEYKKEKIFKLDTENSSYIIKISPYGHIFHLYYGKKVPDCDLEYLIPYNASASFSPQYTENGEQKYTLDTIPQELSCNGCSDLRIAALSVRSEKGFSATELKYTGAEIYGGKTLPCGQPATYGNDEECETLEIYAEDRAQKIKATLYYSVFPKYDAICRRVKIENVGDTPVDIERAFSATYDFNNNNYEIIHLYGAWGKERCFERAPLIQGIQSIESMRGSSSHNHNPFMALCEKSATEDTGEVYGFSFIYSGNFAITSEVDIFSNTRVLVGINPRDFGWRLEGGEVFETPEAVSVFSAEGIGGMSRRYHKLYRYNLCRGKWRDEIRPIIINNWEATSFDFTGNKILDFARKASELGIEMLVMDDGWFGKRNSDRAALGDWYVNESKMNGSLKRLIDEINGMGLKFGIWYEPEMVSPDSDLYRAHPDWILKVDGKEPSQARHQYVLDMSRKDVRDNIFEQMYEVLSKHNIEYVKWDFNRNLSEVGSALLDGAHAKEVYHRYVLGLYDLLDRLLTAFPDLLLEGCSGGGGRFDPAMLYYSPQIWTSDNTDFSDRVFIQYGTSMVYPASSISAHVSACPNKATGRMSPFKARGDVAFSGAFGYELDPDELTEDEIRMVKEQITAYKKYAHIVQFGDYYRLISPYDDKCRAAYMYVSEDKSEALFTLVVMRGALHENLTVKLKGLDKNARYLDESTGRILYGETLMNAGIALTRNYHDGDTVVKHFVKVDE